jgi:hypothetical protein
LSSELGTEVDSEGSAEEVVELLSSDELVSVAVEVALEESVDVMVISVAVESVAVESVAVEDAEPVTLPVAVPVAP